MDEVAMDEDSDEDAKKLKELSKPPSKKDLPLPPNPENVIIKRDYDPKAKHQPTKATTDTYFKSPLTGELIPASSMSEHMRISMLDPKWIEQKQREKKEREDQEEVLAGGFNIEENLKRLAEYRSDVFGSGADEAVIGKKVGEEEEPLNKDIIWDEQAVIEKGPKRSVNEISSEDQARVPGMSDIHIIQKMPMNPMMPMNQINPMNSMQQQQVLMQQQYKLAPPTSQQMGQIRPPVPQVFEAPRETAMLMELVEEPASKRQKTEDQFIPEAEFLAMHGDKGPVKFSVQIPNVTDKPEWNLKGQLIPFSMSLTDTVFIFFDIYLRMIIF